MNGSLAWTRPRSKSKQKSISFLGLCERHYLSAGCLPYAHCALGTSRSQRPAVGRKSDTVEPIPGPMEDIAFLRRGQVPQAHRLIFARGSQRLAIGSKGQGLDGF